jgi:UDP-4-amino-4,6-dideoxy-N-acetyl-beta-L-altrosamine N-acetyltransferase
MTKEDLPIVLAWRNSDRVRSMMYTNHIISQDEHLDWFVKTKDRDNEKHLVFDHQNCPMGVVNVTDINRTHSRCHWGFYIGNQDAPRGSATAMGTLALEFMFEFLAINKVIGEVLAFNEASLKYHLRLGFIEEGRLRQHISRSGIFEDIVTLAHFADRWRATRDRLMVVFSQEATA